MLMFLRKTGIHHLWLSNLTTAYRNADATSVHIQFNDFMLA